MLTVASMKRLVPLLFAFAACGKPGTSENAPPKRDDAGVRRADEQAAPIVIPPLPLGVADVAHYAYRKRDGQPAFRLARDAEAKGDWATVAARCRDALAADANHLDAAYLLAIAYAKTNADPEKIVAPLHAAVAGDFGKWAQASLEQPALQGFLATSLGEAWRKRVDEDRQTYLAALARSLLVTSAHDVYAYDPQATRWHRLTRTGGAVVATLHVRSQHKLAYVTRQKDQGKAKVGIGLVDLAAGRTRRQIEAPPGATLRIGYSTAKQTTGFIVRAGKDAWRVVDTDKLELVKLAAAKTLPDAPAHLADMIRMDVSGRSARIDRTAVPNVSADWDDQSLASAIKIGRSKRVVTVPSPGLIDGDTATWSPDATQLAFVAQLSDECTPNAPTSAAYVADAATGKVQELERAVSGIAVEWLADRKLAIAGDRGVSIAALDGSPAQLLAGADGLLAPRRKPKCVADVPVDDPAVDEE